MITYVRKEAGIDWLCHLLFSPHPQLAQAFMKRCADSIAEICRGENLPWDVTVCGWTEEEEEDRITR